MQDENVPNRCDLGYGQLTGQRRSGVVQKSLPIGSRSCVWIGLALSLLQQSLRADERQLAPISPQQVIPLFNGKDMTGLSTWLKDTHRDDPRKVFTVENGLLHISGDGNGYVATSNEYRDYRLIVEYKWGSRTDGGKSVRNSGILLHATGADGGAGGSWMPSIECQLAQGCVGDLIPIRGKDESGEMIPVRFTSEVVLGVDQRPRWKIGGQTRTFTQGQLWWTNHDPEYKELLDTRGREDVESPVGEWTHVECLCLADAITIRVNGKTVNSCHNTVPVAGKILLQSEGFELYVRKFELHPLKK
jgi:3-keto-disaccharide hydrolase